MIRPLISILLLISMLCYTVQSQSWIRGEIRTSHGEVVVGANVYLEETYDGTSSDSHGHFCFQTTEFGQQIITVTYLGLSDYHQTLQLIGDTITLAVTLKEDAVALRSVEITAGSFEAGGENKREILKPLDILTTAGATGDIAGALNTLPGTQTVGESGRLFVRGGEGYETKTFIDGMQVMNSYSPSAPNTPGRTRFMPYMFSGTSFSTGGYSAEYGQALSSALILNSKFLATQNRVDVSLMSVGTDVGISHTFEQSSLSAKVQYTNLDPYMSLISQDLDWVDAPTSGEGSVAYRRKIGETGVLKAFGHFNSSDFILNRYDILDPSLELRTSIGNRYTYGNAVLQDDLGKGWNYKLGLSYTGNEDRILINDMKIHQSEAGWHSKAVFSKDFADRMTFKVGGEYFDRTFSQDLHNASEQFENRFSVRERLGAFFAESDLYLSSRWLARLGIRSEFNDLNQQFHLAPRLSLAFKTGDKSQVSAAYGLFQQSPENRWLVVDDNLVNEKSAHYILNYQLDVYDRTFRIELYHKTYDQLVKFNPNQRYDPQGFSNDGEGFARGMDLFWRDNKSFDNVDYWISYSYLDTKRDYQDFPTSSLPTFASRHNFSVVYKQFIPAIKSQAGFTYTFGSSRPYHDPNHAEFMRGRTPAYHDLSANLSYLMRQNIIVHLSATNILGANQVFGYEFSTEQNSSGIYPSRAIRPPARRFLFLGVFITFSKDSVMNQLPNL